MKCCVWAVPALLLLVACSDEPSSAKFSLTGSTRPSATASIRGLLPLAAGGLQASPGNVSSVIFRVRSIYLSTATDCSSPVLVADHGTAGVDFDLSTNPTLFTGNPPDGTYVCVGIGMDDIITWTPDEVAHTAYAGCNPSASDTFDIYRTNSGDSPNWKDINGARITATGNGTTMGRDAVFLFASSSTSALAAGAIAPHTNQTVGFTTSLTIPGNAVFYAAFAGQISGSATTCGLEGVSFGFR